LAQHNCTIFIEPGCLSLEAAIAVQDSTETQQERLHEELMELLAYVHTAVEYENPTPEPDLSHLSVALPSSALGSVAGIALAVATVGAAIVASPNQAMAATSTAYSVGSSGEAVTQIQKALGIEADGSYGVKTQTAVMDFQIRQGLKQIDGVVGKETATALGLDEQYRPVYLGVVETNSGIGLNVRSGPGVDYRRIDGLAEGTVVDTYGEVVSYTYDDYYWQKVDDGAWVATDYVTPYDEVSYHDDYYYDDYYYDDYGYYDDGYYDPVSYSDGGGYVDTYYNVGLNIRSGPGLDYYIEDAVPDGTYLPTVDGTVYRDGYAWEELPDGSWIAADYLY
jgi:peptidoglycan hydrolase-like protein with peptidoglycan-binding domain